MLAANVKGVAACHESSSTRSTLRLDVILLKDDPSLSQVVQVGGDDGGIVPGDIVIAKVICYYQDYVGLALSFLGHCEGKEEDQYKVEGMTHHRRLRTVLHHSSLLTVPFSSFPLSCVKSVLL